MSETRSNIEIVIDYCDDVLEGKIKASKKHIRAVERFYNDLAQIENEDYLFYFDVDELDDFVAWSKMFKHTKGILKNKFIELTPFQMFLCAQLFCWKGKKDGLRRFRRAYIQLARKNAKSQLLALIASYVAFLSDEMEEVYIGATTREQSQIVYNEILAQIAAAPDLKGKYKDSYGRITTRRTGSIIQPLSKEARKSGDGKNPSLAIIDEYHQHETDEIYETMKTGMVAREQPLIVVITTAGIDPESPCHKEYKYASDILDEEKPTVTNEAYFVMICELDPDDDIKDESNWIKANPIVATYEAGLKSLREDLQVALEVEEKMEKFLIKNMNIWINAKENGYMNMAKWNRCGINERVKTQDAYIGLDPKVAREKYLQWIYEVIKGKECYIGVDLSSTLDLTSVGFMIPIGEKKFIVLGHSFMPEERLHEKTKTDDVPYPFWVRSGYITLTEGENVDYNYVEKYIEDFVAKHELSVRSLPYDEWNAAQFASNMSDKGFKCVKVIQGMHSLAPPTKDFKVQTYVQNIIHDDNPVIGWAMGNAVRKNDHNENYMLDKDKSVKRIDPVACLMVANSQARFHYYYGDINEGFDDNYLDKLGW